MRSKESVTLIGLKQPVTSTNILRLYNKLMETGTLLTFMLERLKVLTNLLKKPIMAQDQKNTPNRSQNILNQKAFIDPKFCDT